MRRWLMHNTNKETKMAEIEVAGAKIRGGKLMMIIPLISMLGGGLWGGFELFSRYQAMEAKIDEYVAPDLSQFDKKLAIVHNDMRLVTEEVTLFKEELAIIKESITESVGYARDIKHSVRDDLTRIEKVVDKVEDDIKEVEADVREMIDIADQRYDNKRERLSTDVDIQLKDLEDRLNKKLQRALDNPLAN